MEMSKWTMVLSFLFVLIFLHCAFVVNYSSASVKLFPLQTTLGVDSFPQYGLKVWSSDFHISPVADIKNLMVLFGVQVIDKSLSGHCHLTGTCEKDLRVINKANGISLGDCPNRLIQEFFDFYKSDYEMKSVDAILCLHAMSMCELFMPFNKTLIAIASTRYEIGRHSAHRWTEWNRNLLRISRISGNVIAANNKYDQEYIRYFTGLNVRLIPNNCGYITDRYSPKFKSFLIAPARGVNKMLADQLMSTFSSIASKSGKLIEMKHIRDLYPHFAYSDLASHAGIVLLPYQVSFMSLFEFYRMEIPLFVPSPPLLAAWHLKYRILNERTWPSVFGNPMNQRSAVDKHISSNITFDPNDEVSFDAILHWISFADFYQWPHITQFSSFDDLFRILNEINLDSISGAMRVHNIAVRAEIMQTWMTILQGITPHMNRNLPNLVDEALTMSYGVKRSGCQGYVSA